MLTNVGVATGAIDGPAVVLLRGGEAFGVASADGVGVTPTDAEAFSVAVGEYVGAGVASQPTNSARTRNTTTALMPLPLRGEWPQDRDRRWAVSTNVASS